MMRLLADIPTNAVLCYVSGNVAYFTTQALESQWGDDWNDAPYEHNAGPPYTPFCINDWDQHGKPMWAIYKLMFDGPFVTPDHTHANSPFSVDDINAKAIAWLRTDPLFSTQPPVSIPAGTTIQDFLTLIQQGNGTVYWPIDQSTGC